MATRSIRNVCVVYRSPVAIAYTVRPVTVTTSTAPTIMSPTKTRRNERRKYMRPPRRSATGTVRSEEHTSELQSRPHLVCRLLLEKKKRIRRKLNDERIEEKV